MNIAEMELDVFLSKNNITPEEFEKCELGWDLIKAIGADHQSKIQSLEDLADSYAKKIQRFSKVHSVRWRIKDPEHLMVKIIRKTTKDSGYYKEKYLTISVENYFNEITDLIGMRALHLFKQDCFEIIDSLDETWEKKENITVYIRNGDRDNDYSNYPDWNVELHNAGYRSIHFVFSDKPDKKLEVCTEVQVRTIFEEGWSEIDHKIRYPNFSDDEDIGAFLDIFNRLAGSADEMGSFVKALSTTIKDNEQEISSLKVAQQLRDEKIEGLLTKLKTAKADTVRKDLTDELRSQLIQNTDMTKMTELLKNRQRHTFRLSNHIKNFGVVSKHIDAMAKNNK
ncbi:RelA/SpoT domain-containing protein [Pseudoalteromonas arctica]|uniref:RelA/SpoT domain-containing protein n=1 Tax=Pseudoalteromonas arctica TaxID=394751 RepID=UPI001C9D189B|nr:RelA/SpoT domain-containing protein [Pseudoalteromonas arctica]MBZ2192016.1 RelA/SpoT domain-containing protein [Pseudoalteromonas arctica]